MDSEPDALEVLGVLAEPQRARIYGHLTGASHPQTQQEVCEDLSLGRTLVAFHLNKLQRAGLVQTVAPTAARGGRGRPPQRYTVSDRELIATVPPRRYELLAEILVRSIREQSAGEPLPSTAVRVARARGAEMAREGTDLTTDGPSPQTALFQLLSRLGYEPLHEGDALLLSNCPFQRLRVTDRELVCSINAALNAGYLDGLGMSDAVTASLRPCPTNCCVVLKPTA